MHIHIKWQDRDIVNKVLFCLYKLLKWFYTSIYFYYFTFIVLVISVFAPLKVYVHSSSGGETNENLNMIFTSLIDEYTLIWF